MSVTVRVRWTETQRGPQAELVLMLEPRISLACLKVERPYMASIVDNPPLVDRFRRGWWTPSAFRTYPQPAEPELAERIARYRREVERRLCVLVWFPPGVELDPGRTLDAIKALSKATGRRVTVASAERRR